ncbi:hypothetical protein [Paenibacillus cremeus]|uniref:Uncharacterized protein n=1 Tax=Paenibacillus cremeus TaxID=2163881 RepID=A0A559JK81_9BACL|nr:hypothetical protein [Paenibacillus cremeus]TVY00282.1 hypothetical protein FPZ49_33395 [Paenibacillus cremeus]
MKAVKVKQAECKRVLERGGQLCADVEVVLEGEPKALVALFAESKDNDYDMVMLLQKDADTEIDWYDNDLHAAYVDVSETMFDNSSGETYWEPRESFKEQVLSYGRVKEEIRSKLEAAKREHVQV